MGTSARALARRGWIQLAVLAALGLVAAPAGSYSEHSVGTPEQIAWVRRAAGNFVSAELAGNGAGACAILAAPLRASSHGRTCARRWDAKLAGMLRERGERRQLRNLLGATASARVVVHGSGASIDLPGPLIDSANRFLWTENCWMLMR
jgi:hypothetical protein